MATHDEDRVYPEHAIAERDDHVWPPESTTPNSRAWRGRKRIVMDIDGDDTNTHMTVMVAHDADWSGRRAEAIRILVTQGGLTLAAALDELTPVRGPQSGDILSCSWGYDQTRVDFYQVVKVTAKTVTVREIAKRYVTRGYGGEATVMPVVDAFVANEKPLASRRFHFPQATSYRDREYNENKWRYSIRVTDFSHAHLWAGDACHESGEH